MRAFVGIRRSSEAAGARECILRTSDDSVACDDVDKVPSFLRYSEIIAAFTRLDVHTRELTASSCISDDEALRLSQSIEDLRSLLERKFV